VTKVVERTVKCYLMSGESINKFTALSINYENVNVFSIIRAT